MGLESHRYITITPVSRIGLRKYYDKIVEVPCASRLKITWSCKSTTIPTSCVELSGWCCKCTFLLKIIIAGSKSGVHDPAPLDLKPSRGIAPSVVLQSFNQAGYFLGVGIHQLCLITSGNRHPVEKSFSTTWYHKSSVWVFSTIAIMVHVRCWF